MKSEGRKGWSLLHGREEKEVKARMRRHGNLFHLYSMKSSITDFLVVEIDNYFNERIVRTVIENREKHFQMFSTLKLEKVLNPRQFIFGVGG